MSWLPTFEAQTIVSIVIGAVISIITYWLGQRRVKGAEHERLQAVNSQLVSAVVRRIAVDRQVMPGEHYEFVRTAKAQEASIDPSILLNFDQAKARVFSAVIENDFLDVVSKNAIIDLLEASTMVVFGHDVQRVESRPPVAYVAGMNLLLAVVSLSVGIFGAFLSSSEGVAVLLARSRAADRYSGWFEFLLLIVVAIFVGIRLYAVLGRRQRIEKESQEGGPTKFD